eukprot:3761635-Rhodomonas_salina.1
MLLPVPSPSLLPFVPKQKHNQITMPKQTFASRKKKPALLFSTKVHGIHPYHRSAVPWEPGLLFSLGEKPWQPRSRLSSSEIYK